MLRLSGVALVARMADSRLENKLLMRLRELLQTVDLSTTTERQLRMSLEEEFDMDLSGFKRTIRQCVEEYLSANHPEAEEEAGGDSEDETPRSPAPRACKPKESKAKGKRPRVRTAFCAALSHGTHQGIDWRGMGRVWALLMTWDCCRLRWWWWKLERGGGGGMTSSYDVTTSGRIGTHRWYWQPLPQCCYFWRWMAHRPVAMS